MGSRFRWEVAASCVLVGLLASSSCSHDTLKTTTAGLTVRYVPSPSGSGRYDRGSLQISDIQFVPTDPIAAGLLGSNILTLGVNTAAEVTAVSPVVVSQVALTPGTYKVSQMTFGPPLLVDTAPPAVPTTCIENFSAVPSGPAIGDVPSEITFDNPANFEFVVASGQKYLDIEVDVPAMIAGYEGAFTCLASCGGGGPCLSAFDTDAFRVVLLDTVKIH